MRRMFELHLSPVADNMRVVDITPRDIRRAVRTLIDAGKMSTGISLHMYANGMFLGAGKRKP